MKNPRLAILAAALAGAWPTGGFAGEGQPTLLGWNNLGMHCMDDDYSVFSILPPYNTIDAHLFDANGKLVKSAAGITLTFEGVADPDGSINRTVAGKTNFWEFVQPCYGASLPLEMGLTGVRMPGPGNIPQPLTFSGDFNWFEGLGIPIIPVDDAGRRNPYPLLRLTARNAAGTVLATSDVVAPMPSLMKTTIQPKWFTLGAICSLALWSQPARASIAYGSINNFDTVNDTGHECHGFEIEMEDCRSTEVTHTFNYNHYGVPRIEQDDSVPGHPKCIIRWESKKNPDGSWASFTAIPAGPIPPTNGHMFTVPTTGGHRFFRLAHP